MTSRHPVSGGDAIERSSFAGPRSAAEWRRGDSIDEVDGLRGIAILLVMVHRLWPAADPNAIARIGWIGVDLFFVISGFLITRILLATRDEPTYFRNFYARRVLRIFPLYYLFVATLWIGFWSASYRANAGWPGWYFTFLGNLPEGILRHDPPYWLAPVWSLAIEEQFYLTFPMIVRRVDPRRLVYVLAGLFLLAPVVRTVCLVLWPARDRIQYLFTLCRTDAIAAGCLLALATRWRGVARLRRPALAIAVAAAAIGVITALDRETTFGRTAGYCIVALGMAAVVLSVLLREGERATALLRLRPLRYLGRLCFGLYLLHRPAQTLASAGIARLGLDPERVRFVPIKIAVAVGLASLTWVVIERPFLRLKRMFVSGARPAVAAALLAGCGLNVRHHPPDAAGPLPDAGGGAAVVVGESDAAVPPAGRVLYPESLTQSPITPAVAARLAAIAGPGSDRVFAKVGDSITAMTEFATCFDDGPYDFAGSAPLAATRDYYEHGNAGGASPFSRASLAATGGWTTADVLAGPLDHELAAIAPRYGVVLLGTNDNRYGRSVDAYGSDLWSIIDRMIAAGVVPIVTTVPPIHSDPTTDARALLFGRVARAIAQGRQVPLVDLYRELAPLPNQGIGTDGLHPTSAPDGTCLLRSADLDYGFNVRNLVTLEALARAHAAVAGTAADDSAPVREGTGRIGDPFRGRLPLVDLADVRDGDAVLDGYPCGGAGAGHELVYRFDLAAPATIDAFVIDRGAVDVDLKFLAGDPVASDCIASGDQEISVAVPAGPLFVIVDTKRETDGGEFALVVQAH